MAWEITEDYITPEAPELAKSNKEISGETTEFRLLDCDGIVYYEGISDDNSSFAPLDDFGGPNAGCTDIQYLEKGRWEIL